MLDCAGGRRRCSRCPACARGRSRRSPRWCSRPVLLLGELWDNPQIESLRDRAGRARRRGRGLGVLVIVALAALFARRPGLLPAARVRRAAVPHPGRDRRRVGQPAGPAVRRRGRRAWLAYAWVRLRGGPPGAGSRAAPSRRGSSWRWSGSWCSTPLQARLLDRLRAGGQERRVLLRAVRAAAEAADGGRRGRSSCASAACGITVGARARASSAIGFWEYHARELLWNQKVIESNQFESYFRVNSLFFDPNIYGRYLAMVMIGLAARRCCGSGDRRDVALAALVLAVLWARPAADVLAVELRGAARRAHRARRVRWRPWLDRSRVVGAVGWSRPWWSSLAAPGTWASTRAPQRPLDKATSGRFELLARRAGHVRRPAAVWGLGRARSPSASASARTRARSGRRPRRTRSPSRSPPSRASSACRLRRGAVHWPSSCSSRGLRC